MPRRKKAAGMDSAFHQVQKQARSLMVNLQKQIRDKETELKQLKDEAASLGHLTGGKAMRAAAPREASTGGGAKRGGRLDWRAILANLPKQFKAADIRNIRGVKGKRPSEIFAAITRWIEAGTVKRKARGLYERV
jgi:hypothetical protein